MMSCQALQTRLRLIFRLKRRFAVVIAINLRLFFNRTFKMRINLDFCEGNVRMEPRKQINLDYAKLIYFNRVENV